MNTLVRFYFQWASFIADRSSILFNRQSSNDEIELPFCDPLPSNANLRVFIIADRFGATQSISFVEPLSRLRESGRSIIGLLDERTIRKVFASGGKNRVADWMKSKFEKIQPSVICFSRYSGPFSREIQEIAEQREIPIIGHIDDDLFAVPRSLGLSKYLYYRDPVRQGNLRDTLEGCNLVYTSTKPLMERLQSYGITAPLTAGEIYCSGRVNCIRDYSRREKSQLTIGYMGTSGHERDFELVIPALKKLLRAYRELRVELVGTIRFPFSFGGMRDRVVQVPGVQPYEKFKEFMRSLEWDIGLAPLRDIQFNKCKAETKWVEYTAAGIPVVASNVEAYRRVGNYGGAILVRPDEWEKKLKEVINNRTIRERTLSRARSILTAEFSLDRLESQVLEIIRKAGAMRR